MDPPMIERRRLKLMYVTQVGHAPPRLAFFANVERDIPAHYLRFLATRFRAALKLVGTPLVLEFRRTGRTWADAGASREPRSGKSRSGKPRSDKTRFGETGARTRRAAPKKSRD